MDGYYEEGMLLTLIFTTAAKGSEPKSMCFETYDAYIRNC